VLLVIPVEEVPAEVAGVDHVLEAVREVRPILEGLELSFGVWIVVGDVRPGVSFIDAQVRKQQGHRFAGHGGAAVGVQGKLLREDVLLEAGLPDELLRNLSGIVSGHRPANHIAAEDIEQDVEMEVGGLGAGTELGDIPGPQLIGSRGKEFRFGVGGVTELVSPLTDLLVLAQDAIHGADGAEESPLIQESSIDFGGREVHEARRAKDFKHLLTLGGSQQASG
jgi:hypothetical protein